MNVGIDVSSLIYQRGVSRYTTNLVRSLVKKPNVNLHLYGYNFRQQKALQKAAQALLNRPQFNAKHQVTIQPYPPSLQTLFWQIGLNPITKQLPNIDLFHSWDWLQPPDKNIPLVSTIHDLAILKFPDTAHQDILKHHWQSWKILKERQAQIIAVSHATKKDLINLLEFPAWQITVIHEALPLEITQVSESLTEEIFQQIKMQMDLSKPFILFVGTREPRKNLLRLIQAWSDDANLHNAYQLVIAGEAGWDATSDQNAAKYLKNQPNLRFLGRVSDEQLAVLYAQASVFAYPSLDEGFGLPILEAFYHGTPVVTANRSAMIEVAGNAATLVEPESVESISLGLQQVLNETLSEQQKRLQRMIIRLQMFDWHKVAEETLNVYQKAYADAN